MCSTAGDAIVQEFQLTAEMAKAVRDLQEREENLEKLRQREAVLVKQHEDRLSGPSEAELKQLISGVDAEIAELREALQRAEGDAEPEQGGAQKRWGNIFASSASKAEEVAQSHGTAPVRRRGFVCSSQPEKLASLDRSSDAVGETFESRASALIPLAATPSK